MYNVAQIHDSEFSFCPTDGFTASKTSNVASSHNGCPFRVVEFGGTMYGKFDACAYKSKSHSTVLNSSVAHIEISVINVTLCELQTGF